MNGRPNLFELLARLPPRIWLQAALGLIGFIVLAVLGFAVIAGFVAVGLVILLLYRLRAWVARLFGQPPAARPPARTVDPEVIDVPYEVIEQPKDKRP